MQSEFTMGLQTEAKELRAVASSTTLASIGDLIKSLGYQALVTEEGSEIKAQLQASNEVFTLTFRKDTDYTKMEIHSAIMREVNRINPTIPGEGAQAGDSKKIELAGKGVPQPGAEIVPGHVGAFETPKRDEGEMFKVDRPQESAFFGDKTTEHRDVIEHEAESAKEAQEKMTADANTEQQVEVGPNEQGTPQEKHNE